MSVKKAEVYICEACGTTGELNELHHEIIAGVKTCLECNAGGQLSTKEEIEAFEQMVESRKPKFDFDLGEI